MKNVNWILREIIWWVVCIGLMILLTPVICIARATMNDGVLGFLGMMACGIACALGLFYVTEAIINRFFVKVEPKEDNHVDQD